MLLCSSVVSSSLGSHRLQPARLLCPWDSPGQNAGVGYHFLPPGDRPNPGIEPLTPVLAGNPLPRSHQGSLGQIINSYKMMATPTTNLITGNEKNIPDLTERRLFCLSSGLGGMWGKASIQEFLTTRSKPLIYICGWKVILSLWP